MINTAIFLEKFLQNYRFKMVRSYLIGSVLDFGGNEGELGELINNEYQVVNYDHSMMDCAHADTILCLAVVEHIVVEEVYKIFSKFKTVLNKDGRIFLTTPTKMAKPILEFLAWIGVLDRQNIAEHKHYWGKRELYDLAKKTGFVVKKYRKFQLGFNQLAVFEH